jgi:hypothetical protein
MNADGVRRALKRVGENITLRRLTGTQRIPFDVMCRAKVTVGAATVLVGGIEQNADRVLMTADEIDAARWPGLPHHGDLVIYDDGRTATVQGRSDVTQLGADRVLTFPVLGAIAP